MLETPAACKVFRARQTSLNGTVVATRRGLRSVLAQQLYSSCDGRGLAKASQVPAQHQWVTSGDTSLNGHAYIGAIKIRGNLVATALRSARGRPHTDIRCDCCGKPEALSHILQSCPRTHASRIARHDPAIREWAQSCYEPRHIAFEALAINWRGLLASRTAAALRRLGLSARFLSLASAVALECGTWILNHFRRSTYTIRSR